MRVCICVCLCLLSVQGGTDTAPDIRWKLKRMQAMGILPHVRDVSCYDWNCFFWFQFLQQTEMSVFKGFILHASSFRNPKNTVTLVNCVRASGTGNLIPAKHQKEEALLVFYLCGPLPHPHKSPYSWPCSLSERMQTLPT